MNVIILYTQGNLSAIKNLRMSINNVIKNKN